VREPDPSALPAQSASDVLSAESASDLLPAESASNALPTEPTASILREPDPALPADSASTLHAAEPAASAVCQPATATVSADATSTVYAAQPTAALVPGESAAARLHRGESGATVLTDSELAELSGESELYSTTNHGYPDVYAGPGIHSGRRRWSGSSRSRSCRAGVHIHADHVSHVHAADHSHVHTADQHVDHYSHALHTIHAGNAHDLYAVYSEYRISANHTIRWRGRRIWGRLLA
jgi:hypothetical protein